MEATIEQVAQHCNSEFILFQQCLDQTTNPVNCQKALKSLNLCTQEKVPSVQRVRLKCEPYNRAFGQCMLNNAQQPELCTDQLRALSECAEALK